MSNQPTSKQNPDLEELTAYLDGELSPEANEAVERRLATDLEYRNQLRELEQTWDLLDVLPTANPDARFTQSTIELAVSTVQKRPTADRRTIWRGVVFFGLIPLCVFAASYLLTRYQRLYPLRQLVNEFRIIENFDLYRKVDLNLDFVRKIADELEHDSMKSPAQNNVVLEDDPEASERLLRTLPEEKLVDIKLRQNQYNNLNAEERERIRKFHRELTHQVDAAKLYSAIKRFYEWLKTIPYEEQVQLLVETDTEKKFEIFTKLRNELSSQVDRLPDNDMKVFNEWLNAVGQTHGYRLKAILSEWFQNIRNPETRERLLKAINDDPEVAVRTYLRTVRLDRPNELASEYATLRERLSPEGQKMMGDSRETQDDFVVQMLMRPEISQEKLENFYFQELTPKEREELDRLSPEVMKNRVRELYMRRKLLIQPPRRQ